MPICRWATAIDQLIAFSKDQICTRWSAVANVERIVSGLPVIWGQSMCDRYRYADLALRLPVTNRDKPQITSVWPTAHSWPPAAEVAYKIVGIRRSCVAFFLGTPLPVSKCDAAITAGTYSRVSAGINRLPLKTAKSLLPDLKTAFRTTSAPTLYAARASDQSPNCACRSRRYRAAARVDFRTSRRSSVSLVIVRPKRRAVSGMNCQIPRAPLGESAVG